MMTITDKTTIASLSELRTKSEEILKQLADHKVILQKHNRPVAVMLAFKQYEYLEKLLDLVEEYALGNLAKARDERSGRKDFIDIEKW